MGNRKNGSRAANARVSLKRIIRVNKRLGRGTGWLGSNVRGSGREDRTEFVNLADSRSE